MGAAIVGTTLSGPTLESELVMLPTVAVRCPYCGERIELMIDADAEVQRYAEDCPVCCRPMAVCVALDGSGETLVSAVRDDQG